MGDLSRTSRALVCNPARVCDRRLPQLLCRALRHLLESNSGPIANYSLTAGTATASAAELPAVVNATLAASSKLVTPATIGASARDIQAHVGCAVQSTLGPLSFKYGNGLFASFGFSSDRQQLSCLDYSSTNRGAVCSHDGTTKFGLDYAYGSAGSNNGQIFRHHG